MFRYHVLSAQIRVTPAKARATIEAAYRKSGAHLADAAVLLDCSHRQLTRWIERLDMTALIEELEGEAKREGWHHGKTGGRPRGTTAKRVAKRCRRRAA